MTSGEKLRSHAKSPTFFFWEMELKVVEVLKIARECNRVIITNFTGTLTVDAAGVSLAAFGYLNPVIAALIHASSELVLILNSARLLSGSPSEPSSRMSKTSSRIMNPSQDSSV
jgi:hypothetical protein